MQAELAEPAEPQEYHDLDDFVVSESESEAGPASSDEAPQHPDRIRQLTETANPNQDHTQKILKAHISVLVSALGGPDYTNNNQYKLGHDALACLKDIKRWIKSVDENNRSFDVALACADSGLVINDLIVILCQWDSQSSRKTVKNARTMEKIMLANLELLVLLTWPTELTPESSEKQKISFSNLRKCQITYKKHILHYNKGQTLKAAIRLVLPSMAKDKIDRDPRDNAILRLVLFFIRNILYISPVNSSVSAKRTKDLAALDNMPSNVSLEDISLNSVLGCFKKNKVLMFLLTLSSSLGSDFDKQMFGSACIECIHLLVGQVNTEHLIKPVKNDNKDIEETPVETSGPGSELGDFLKEENRRKASQLKNLSTRHGRFGSLLSIQGDKQSYVVSGQEALHDSNLTLDKLDKSKKWSKPKSFRYDSDEYVKQTIYLSTGAAIVLKEFVNQFLSGDCFNNLISNVSNLLSSVDDFGLIDPYERAVYFLTVAWFLKYKRERNEYLKSSPMEMKKLTSDDDQPDFASISAGLSQTNFILILNYFRISFQGKQWSSVHVAMLVFLQLLMISHTLFISKPKDSTDSDDSQEDADKELGEGIVRNLFTSYDFLNVLVQVPQSASKHSPEYLKTCINIVHILLKAFESFAKENVKLYIQKRRRKLKTKANPHDMESRLTHRLDDIMEYSDEEEDNQRAREEKIERELDLSRTERRFFHTSTVSSYIDFLYEYEDLSHEDIKRCLSYFHRIFVVRKDYTGLYRLDFMYIIHRLRNHLPRSSNIRNHVDEFIVYFMKKFKAAFARFPNPIELLFPRFEDIEFKTFLGTGELAKSNTDSKSQPKLAKEIEFIREFPFEERVKILVSALYLQEKEMFISWLIAALDEIIKQRLQEVASGSPETNLKPLSLLSPDKFKRLFINNPYVRCLLSLVKFELPDILEENCELPGSVPSAKLVEFLELIKKYISLQPVAFEDGKDAFFFMTTKDSYGGYDDDINYNGYDPNDDSIAFETEGNVTKSLHSEQLDDLDRIEASISTKSGPVGIARKKKLKQPKKTKPKSAKPKERQGGSIARVREPEPSRPVKSSEYVNESDDESDDEKSKEFFAREEKLRRLIQGTGGIVSATQLQEFKKVWARLGSDPNVNIDSSVTDAIEAASEQLRASQYDADSQLQSQPVEDNTPEADTNVSAPDIDGSTQLLFSESEADESSESEDDKLGSDSDKENQVISKKRQIVFSDEESDNDNSYVSAVSELPSRKRVNVIDDDDD